MAVLSSVFVAASAFMGSILQVSRAGSLTGNLQLQSGIRKRRIPASSSIIYKHDLNHNRNERRRMASSNEDGNDSGQSKSTQERSRGIIFAVTVALGANAPFLYVMANPPSAEEREAMLMDFCTGDVCALLGGGSGYGGGDQGEAFIGTELAEGMPTVEEFESMARVAAELAIGAVGMVTGELNL
eukprot:CAMPEP_0194095066 /NCGR_PEP_ID=MMETSP0149-20130528/56632_1 /TAXON_ID=122233 /ORGANISM="Chaetoceros debilis, Strain MM31A-1" /LENGTH=184 /DNA_ID=CAMNT_0038780997 /DNA_START=206 /DNA_END=760 /DNA_ORIENTATION=-